MGVHTSAEAASRHLLRPLGGAEERAQLDNLMESTAAGRGGGLRIVGERGLGKSSLVDYVTERATEFRVLRARAAAAERDMPFAGLHLLCGDLLDECPPAHAGSLTSAFGLADEPRPGVDSVGPAVLSLFAALARSKPLCVAVDDAQWLDRATAGVLAYVAARAHDRAIMILVAGEGVEALSSLEGLPSMCLRPLSRDEVRTRLASVSPGPIDEMVTERLLAESRGNVRVLVESLDGLTAADLAGGFAIPAPHARRRCRHENPCQARAARLAPALRRLLMAAAADLTGDVALFERLATEFGVDARDLVKAGLIAVDDRVTFTCPGLRSVTYHSAASTERRLVHRKLGESTAGDGPRRAWHLGLAAAGHDDGLADDLEGYAALAQQRGGIAARGAFLERAALLTADPDRRADRALAASAAMHDSGDLAAAQRLLALVPAEPQETLRQARHRRHLARIETVVRPGENSARQLLTAARRLRPLDATDAREAYLEALLAAMSAAESTDRGLLIVTATEARAAVVGVPRNPAGQILHGLATRVLDGYACSVEPLRTAVAAFRQPRLEARSERWLGLAVLIAGDIWDSQAWRELGRTHPATGRRSGLEDLLTQISLRARSHDAKIAETVAAAISHNAAGRYDQAVDAAREAVRSEHSCFTGWALAELVEAAVRAGDSGLAAEVAARLYRRTTPAGTDWALGVQATAEALLADGDQAEAAYRHAIERLSRTGLRYRLARAELLFGEWLRRRNRRVDARTQLRAASEHFAELGAVAFVERARRELLATGPASRKRTTENHRQLTPQEARVATLARDGLSNGEIAEQLFVSPRTVEYHLYKAFAKLGVNSRAKLQRIQEL